jgi:hypothetical protein
MKKKNPTHLCHNICFSIAIVQVFATKTKCMLGTTFSWSKISPEYET